jgi:hypothetical protein
MHIQRGQEAGPHACHQEVPSEARTNGMFQEYLLVANTVPLVLVGLFLRPLNCQLITYAFGTSALQPGYPNILNIISAEAYNCSDTSRLSR